MAVAPGETEIKTHPARLPVGEVLVYKVTWLGIPVGTAKASVKGIKKINGRDAYELEIEARTNEFCSRIYRIEDRYISYMDVNELYTLRHEVYRRDGRYRKDAVTDFDQINHKAYFQNFLDKSKKVLDIPPGVQDPVSMIYYFRMVPLKIGEMKEYNVYNNESTYQIYGVADRLGMIKVPHLGMRKVFHLQPYAKLKGEEVKRGRASAYFSCDEDRIPLIGIVKGPVFTQVVGYLEKGDPS
ncbi:MAG: DUF3108 domain-containing protein [Candidatus Omnitrophica bacterium]|nr:DUF3108 domain-containing protein [Candidatus Omnitrophota bacterium]